MFFFFVSKILTTTQTNVRRGTFPYWRFTDWATTLNANQNSSFLILGKVNSEEETTLLYDVKRIESKYGEKQEALFQER